MLTPDQIAKIRQDAGLTPLSSSGIPTQSLSDKLGIKSSNNVKSGTVADKTLPLTTRAGIAAQGVVNQVGQTVDKVVGPIANNIATGEVNTANALVSRGKNLATEAQTAGQADAGKPLIDQVLGAVSFGAKKGIENIAGGVGDIIANMASPFIPQRVKDVYHEELTKSLTDIKNAYNDPNLNPDTKQSLHDFVHSIAAKANVNPETAQIVKDTLGDTFNIATLGAGGTAEKAATTVVERGATAVADTAKPIIEAAQMGLKNVAEQSVKTAIEQGVETSAKAFTNSIDEAKKIMNPSGFYTQAEKEAALSKGNIATKGKGIFAKEVVNPATTKQTETIAELVNNGKISSKNLPSQNIEAINQEARISDSNINDIVNRPEFNKPFTQKTLNTVFDNVTSSAKKNLIFVPETTEAKAYQQVIDAAKEEIAKQSYNNAGLRTGIKAFNARMEQILGKDIYSGASESVSNARLQAAKDVRTELNNFLADNLESPSIKKSALADTNIGAKLPAKSTFEYGRAEAGAKYKAELQREAQLLNAKDEIAYRASKTIDKTRLAEYLKKHPLQKNVLKYGAFSVGGAVLGGGLLKELGL